MAIGAVPYALQNASHSASVFRIAQSAPFATGGILASNELPVSQQGTPNMSVILGPGRCQVVGNSVSPPAGQVWTTQAQYNAYNDANLTLTVAASNPTNPRIDAVYIQVQDSFYSGASNTAIAGVVTGTPAASPVAPSVPTNSILIAYIAVAANATTIVNANISYQASVATLLGVVPSNQIASLRVIPTSAVGGTLGANGQVTFSSASAVSINGCFSATFDNYRIVIEVSSASAAITVGNVLRVGGTDSTASNYDIEVLQGVGSTAASALAVAQPTWTISGGTSGTIHDMTLELKRPFLTQATFGTALSGATANPAVTPGVALRTISNRLATSFDGMTVTFSGGTATGVIRIFGWNNN